MIINKPEKRTFWRVTVNGIVHEGFTDPDQETKSGQPDSTQSENADVVYPPLPQTGWLDEGAIYSYMGGMVRVRQGHNRTNHPPSEIPALFEVHRANTDNMDWIAGEAVIRGDERIYNIKTYICIQSHTTQADWTPPTTPALWRKKPEVIIDLCSETEAWTINNATQYQTDFMAGRDVYVKRNNRIWKAKNATHLWIAPTLTGNGSISWQFVKLCP